MFLALTLSDIGKPIYINVNHIATVYQNLEKGCTIITIIGEGEDAFLSIKETPDYIFQKVVGMSKDLICLG